MLLDAEWSNEDGQHLMKLGPIFRAEISHRGTPGQYGLRWIAVLNGQQLTDTADLEYAKGYVEWEIVKTMTNLSIAYRVLKARPPVRTYFPMGHGQDGKLPGNWGIARRAPGRKPSQEARQQLAFL